MAAARLALAGAGVAVAAALVGAGAALRQVALGAALLAFALFFGRSRRPLEATLGEAVEVPAGEPTAPAREAVVAALFPSSVGVAILMAAALPVDARLAAILAGLLAGMGFASLVSAARVFAWERRYGLRLYGDRRTEQLYAAERSASTGAARPRAG